MPGAPAAPGIYVSVHKRGATVGAGPRASQREPWPLFAHTNIGGPPTRPGLPLGGTGTCPYEDFSTPILNTYTFICYCIMESQSAIIMNRICANFELLETRTFLTPVGAIYHKEEWSRSGQDYSHSVSPC